MALDNYRVARPYAKAVFEDAKSKDTLDKWQKTLLILKEVIQQPEVEAIIETPEASLEQKKEFFLGFAASEDIKSELENFIRILLEKKRIAVLAEIADIFGELFELHHERLQVVVNSYSKLNDLQIEKLKQSLGKRFNKKIEIHNEIDESLLGGVVINAGDVVIDMSVTSQLKNMVNKLVA